VNLVVLNVLSIVLVLLAHSSGKICNIRSDSMTVEKDKFFRLPCAICNKMIVIRKQNAIMTLEGVHTDREDKRIKDGKAYCLDHLPKRK